MKIIEIYQMSCHKECCKIKIPKLSITKKSKINTLTSVQSVNKTKRMTKENILKYNSFM